MKIDVTQDALLRALVEAIRDERDHGEALMRLMLRLVSEAGRKGWFETHWRTEARLKLVQAACGDMPKDWRSAAPAFDVIAEAARLALKAEVGSEGRAALLAIVQLIDAERSVRTSAMAEIRPASKRASRRKATSVGQGRRARTGASPSKPAVKTQVQARPTAKAAAARKAGAKVVKARPVAKAAAAGKANGAAKGAKARIAAKPAAARKANGAAKVSKSRTMQPAKAAGAAKGAKARIAAKPAAARKANGAAKVSKSRMMQPAKAAGAAKARIAAKSAAARKANGAAKVSKSRTVQPVKVAAVKVAAAKVAKVQPAAKVAAAHKSNSRMPANQTLPNPATAL